MVTDTLPQALDINPVISMYVLQRSHSHHETKLTDELSSKRSVSTSQIRSSEADITATNDTLTT
jgi:hypothetical protein